MMKSVMLYTLAFVGALLVAFALAGAFIDFLHISLVGLFMVVGLLVLWAGTLYDVWRRADVGMTGRLVWTAVVILLPLLGVLIYVFTRPSDGSVTYRGEQIA